MKMLLVKARAGQKRAHLPERAWTSAERLSERHQLVIERERRFLERHQAMSERIWASLAPLTALESVAQAHHARSAHLVVVFL